MIKIELIYSIYTSLSNIIRNKMADTYSSENYCYDKNDNYYIRLDEMKLKKITKPEYMDATG